MTLLELPWLDASIATTLVGALWVGRVRDPIRAARLGLAFTALAFGGTFLAWLAFYSGADPAAIADASPQVRLFGRRVLALDELSAPLVPAVALLHFLTALATTRTKMRRFSFAWSLTSETIRLAMFSCRASWLLVLLLTLCAIPPYFELRNRGRPTRVYAAHMGLFVALLVLGWAGVEASRGAAPPTWAAVLLMAAILVRCGTVPAHCWATDWFEHASFGVALLFVAPLAGVYAAVRLVLPIAPAWVLQGIGIASLFTAVYAAGMAAIQRDCRRLFANLFLSHASLVLVGLELHTEMSLTGSLCLWFSVILSLGGFGLTIRALEARYGRLPLAGHLGLYEHSPSLAACFLLTGLACVGFPGTLGFISAELVVDSAVEVSPYVGIAVVAAAALNGIAVVRAYLILFAGARHVSSVPLGIVARERLAVLTFSALILGGGLFPQPGVTTRHKAAAAILEERRGLMEGPARPVDSSRDEAPDGREGAESPRPRGGPGPIMHR
ncbi:NAD(P)H-quinone oxidoreductase chain 4 1 [Aquisphaera giovannonii]|uniref:NAD(P)H-quinone oxidoreductase chain 4 1 n=1 Tax=Aquisphaera giovannonii TaxID=406548 RepID=A0A5B9W140_9BACT|nr:proton-conducting transporter membrane subunit [Aquisphaera giovannonii]QEH33944.1 NAD(P)H-quinone oxidoreductase chain 4 1 [Aquisphaera giovannonii]